jgi:hypothetical protein
MGTSEQILRQAKEGRGDGGSSPVAATQPMPCPALGARLYCQNDPTEMILVR